MKHYVMMFLLTGIIIGGSSCQFILTSGAIAEAPIDISGEIQLRINEYVQKNMSEDYEGPFPRRTRLDRVEVDDSTVRLHFNQGLVSQPVRQALVDELRTRFTLLLKPLIENAKIEIYAGGRRLEDYIPGLYRSDPSGRSL